NPNQIQEARQQRRAKENLQTTKEEIPNVDEMAAKSRAISQNQAGRPSVTETIVRTEAKIGRNDKVTIQNVMSGEQKTLKYKQAESLLKEGSWIITK
ncbi:hypothetical protein OAA74_04530, partial [Flavobacteriaceae bacterium]|nr:hypothetical protein [Flavobacteriaceae bacterium]